jgi:hypothetical protein
MGMVAMPHTIAAMNATHKAQNRMLFARIMAASFRVRIPRESLLQVRA